MILANKTFEKENKKKYTYTQYSTCDCFLYDQ